MSTVVRLYSLPEVGEVIGADRSTVHRLIKAGKLRAVMRGSVRRVRADDLAAYIDGLEVAS